MAPVGRQGSDLPAPYVSPWRRLGRDLQDLAAWTVLKVRELVRRNAQSDLPRPAFWPDALAPLFWPLVLAAAPVLAWTAVQLLSASATVTGQEPPPSPVTAPSPGGMPSAGSPSEPGRPPVGESPGPSPATIPATPPIPPPAEPREPAVPREEEPALAEDTGGPDTFLLDRFNGATEGELVVVGIATDPASGTLQLRLSPGFGALAPESRERAAERWLRDAADLGYGNLELSGSDGRPLGRNALVGSGMILLDAAAK